MRLAQGAEAVIERTDDTVVKDRVRKRYRHPQLDAELRKSRSRRERKMLEKAGKLVPVPIVKEGDDERVVMEYVDGPALKEVLDAGLAERVGRHVGELHDHHIIHGDLTTSNMVVRDGEVVLIDFGLSSTSHKPEDKAVDLHLFKQALESKHYGIAQSAYRAFLKGYRASYDGHGPVLERLRQVERRGRNKAKH